MSLTLRGSVLANLLSITPTDGLFPTSDQLARVRPASPHATAHLIQASPGACDRAGCQQLAVQHLWSGWQATRPHSEMLKLLLMLEHQLT